MFPLSLFMKTTLAKNVQLKDKTWYVVYAKDQILGRATPLPAASVCDLGWRGARGVVLSFGAGALTSAYVYLPDFERTVTRCTVHYRQGSGEFRAMADASYPFDFTLPVAGDAPLEFWFETESKAGPTEKSPVGRLQLK